MHRFLFIVALAFGCSRFVIAQPALSTEFPAGSTSLEPAVLSKLIAGKVFKLKPANGPEIRVEYRDSWAYFNAGNASDFGRWQAEGSAICIKWTRIPPGCSEMRMVGDTLYTKRASNGEVLPLHPD